MVDQHYTDLQAALDRLDTAIDFLGPRSHSERIAQLENHVEAMAEAVGRLESQLSSIDGNGMSAADVLLRLLPFLDIIEPHLDDFEQLITSGGGWLGRIMGGG